MLTAGALHQAKFALGGLMVDEKPHESTIWHLARA
jgi:hypothetical protein